MLHFSKVIFVDGGKSSDLSSLLLTEREILTISVPGDMSISDAVNLVEQGELEYFDNTVKKRIQTSLFISGGHSSAAGQDEEEKAESSFFRSGVVESSPTPEDDEDITYEEQSDETS